MNLNRICHGFVAVAISLSSVGQYLVFGSSDLSVERNEFIRIYCLKRILTDVMVRIYPKGICIFFGLSLLSAGDRVWWVKSVQNTVASMDL